jgi:hypothetical protein
MKMTIWLGVLGFVLGVCLVTVVSTDSRSNRMMQVQILCNQSCPSEFLIEETYPWWGLQEDASRLVWLQALVDYWYIAA